MRYTITIDSDLNPTDLEDVLRQNNIQYRFNKFLRLDEKIIDTRMWEAYKSMEEQYYNLHKNSKLDESDILPNFDFKNLRINKVIEIKSL